MKHLRNVIAVFVLIFVIYLVTNYAGLFQQQIGVKGASTQRGQGIANQIGSDVGTQVDAAKSQAMHVSLSDVVNYLSRFQRVPQDVNNVKNFMGKQISSLTKKK